MQNREPLPLTTPITSLPMRKKVTCHCFTRTMSFLPNLTMSLSDNKTSTCNVQCRILLLLTECNASHSRVTPSSMSLVPIYTPQAWLFKSRLMLILINYSPRFLSQSFKNAEPSDEERQFGENKNNTTMQTATLNLKPPTLRRSSN